MKIRNYRKDLSANEITPVISFDPLKYIKSCGYIAPEFRNKELEKNLMLAAKVELELLLTLSDESKINQWFPSFKIGMEQEKDIKDYSTRNSLTRLGIIGLWASF